MSASKNTKNDSSPNGRVHKKSILTNHPNEVLGKDQKTPSNTIKQVAGDSPNISIDSHFQKSDDPSGAPQNNRPLFSADFHEHESLESVSQVQRDFRRKTSMSLIVSEDSKADELDEEKLDFLKMSKQQLEMQLRITEINEFKCQIRLSHFLEFFFYHIVYFLAIGPFLSLFIIFQKGGRHMAFNMGFTPTKQIIFIIQVVLWVFTIIPLVLFFMDYGKSKSSISIFEIESLVSSTIIRCVFVSAKYGSFSKEYIRLLKSMPHKMENLQSRMLLMSWWNQDTKVISKEFKLSTRRNNIDMDHFTIFFQNKVPEKRIEAMEKIREVDVEQDPDRLNIPSVAVKNLNDKEGYSAEFIGKDLIHLANQGLSRVWVVRLIYVFILIRTQAANLSRQIYGEFYFGSTWEDIIINFCISFIYYFNMTTSFKFLISSLLDLIIKKRVLEQLSHMISPFKNSFVTSVKYYPTINYLCPLSFTAWFNLRTSIMNYGEGFYNRSVFSVTGFFIVCGVKVVYLSLALFGFFTIDSNKEMLMLLSTIGLEAIPVLVIFMLIILVGASVNGNFLIHRKLMNDLKNIFKHYRLLGFTSSYLSEFTHTTNKVNPQMTNTLGKGFETKKSENYGFPVKKVTDLEEKEGIHNRRMSDLKQEGKGSLLRPNDEHTLASPHAYEEKSEKGSENEKNSKNLENERTSRNSEQINKSSSHLDSENGGKKEHQASADESGLLKVKIENPEMFLSQNPIIKSIQRQLLIEQKLNDEQIDRRMEVLEDIIESSIDSLALIEEITPQKCCGVKLTAGLFWSVVTLIFSLVIFYLEFRSD